jgi:catechol 2,3-dioxygenase-like lactoylglutathione lyase family enzyme
MDTLGIHHLGLPVSDLPSTVRFFTECLGWSIVREISEYPAVFVTNESAFITLWQVESNARHFDRKQNVGLHHFAIRVSSEQALYTLFEKVAAHSGVAVEFAPEYLQGGPAKHCMVFEPSGIRVELIWLP